MPKVITDLLNQGKSIDPNTGLIIHDDGTVGEFIPAPKKREFIESYQTPVDIDYSKYSESEIEGFKPTITNTQKELDDYVAENQNFLTSKLPNALAHLKPSVAFLYLLDIYY